MKKHAYLVIAHNNFEQLKFLISLLDDSRNDIFVLIDKKVNISSADVMNVSSAVKKSNIHWNTDAIDINWGGYSQIEAEMKLLEMACDGHYDYYHLISGSDLPLASQDTIHSFFDTNPDRIFISIVNPDTFKKNNITDRIKYKHFFNEVRGRGITLREKIYRKLDSFIVLLQKVLRFSNLKKYGISRVGYTSNWFSIDDDTARQFIENKQLIRDLFKFSFCCDEVFLLTIIYKLNIEDKIFYRGTIHDRFDEFQGNLRYINWWDGGPYVWKDGDTKKLDYAIGTGHLFSRKFSLDDSPNLKNYILKKNR